MWTEIETKLVKLINVAITIKIPVANKLSEIKFEAPLRDFDCDSGNLNENEYKAQTLASKVPPQTLNMFIKSSPVAHVDGCYKPYCHKQVRSYNQLLSRGFYEPGNDVIKINNF